MGKRSTNSTKGGKFMNPTDQARKEARKKELKKNKRQRQLVRAAVLKGKNPRDIVQELEKLDDMEFNVLIPAPLNDKVLREKRRKLHDTWARVIRMYEREDVEQYIELKKLWHCYQNRKHEVVQHFESVRNAQNVQVDEIPLPDLPLSGPAASANDTENIPLPPTFQLQPKGGILKKPSVLETLKPKTCPGVPMGPPPKLEEYEDESNNADKASDASRRKTIRFNDEGGGEEQSEEVSSKREDSGDASGPQVDEIQRKMLQMAGQDVDQYMREMEEVHRKTQAEKSAEMQQRLAKFDPPNTAAAENSRAAASGSASAVPLGASSIVGGPSSVLPQQPNTMVPPGHVPQIPTAPIMYRPAPPPLRPGVAPAAVRLPPGPPPGRPPLRMPPGPPPGGLPGGPLSGLAGPGGIRRPTLNALPPRGQPQGVVSAAPKINKEASATPSASGVIEAKPQMRNLKSDITRFVPTNVKLRTDGGPKKKQADPLQDVFKKTTPQPQALHQTSKDDAYAEFMKEMDQFLK